MNRYKYPDKIIDGLIKKEEYGTAYKELVIVNKELCEELNRVYQKINKLHKENVELKMMLERLKNKLKVKK